MRTITQKEIKKFVLLANRASRAAMVHDRAQHDFMMHFQSIFGETLESNDQKSGSDDPLVDIIDYGTNITDIKEMTEIIGAIIDDNKNYEGNFIIE